VFILTIGAILLLLFGAFDILGKIVGKGISSGELWSDSKSFDSQKITTLVKKKGKDFRILVFSDIQLAANPLNNQRTLDLIDEMVKDTGPDMIMTTGDNVSWFFGDVLTKTLVKKLDSFKIPWGVTLGNHDSEWIMDRNWHGNQYENAEYSVFRMGPGNIHGVGNYNINISDDEGNIIYSLIMLDSNSRRKYPEGKGYDYIYDDQINWYKWVIKAQKDIPSMLFFHIPLPEYKDAWLEWEAGRIDPGLGVGSNHEGIASPPVNSGLFKTIKDLKSTTNVFCGHDHLNNLSVPYKGIRLSYGTKTGPSSYSHKGKLGATLVTIKHNSSDVEVEHVYHVVKPLLWKKSSQRIITLF